MNERQYLAAAIAAKRRIPSEMRQRVMARDNFICHYCGSWATEIDHVIPGSRGGLTVDWNLVAACETCNRTKSDRTPAEWRAAGLFTQVPTTRLQPLRGRRVVRRARRIRRGLR